MRPLLPLLLMVTLVAWVPATAATTHEVDFFITFRADGNWTYDGPLGMLTPRNETRGEQYAWDITVADEAAIGEVRYTLDTFDIERAKQFQPAIDGGDKRFPLFHFFPGPDVWNTDGTAQVYHIDEENDQLRLRLQIPQVTQGVFTLTRDVTSPEYTLGPVERLTEFSFYQETRTEEMAIADLQVRKAGTDGEWVRNPTPDFHVLQKFPIQGLDADTRYEARVVFTDWSENNVTTDPYTVQTFADDQGSPPSFAVLSPEPNATLPSGADVTVRVRIHDGDTPLDPASVRLFFDLSEVSRHELSVDEGVVTYAPGALDDGTHVVSVEARTMDGAKDHVQWRFQVGEEGEAHAPGVTPPLVVLVLAGLALLSRRRSAS